MPENKKPQTANDKLDSIISQLETIMPLIDLIEIAPDIRAIVRERREQEIFNKQAAKLGRVIVVIAAAVGTVVATAIAVSKMIVTIGR